MLPKALELEVEKGAGGQLRQALQASAASTSASSYAVMMTLGI
jgi:hypothetical protein